MTIIKIILQEYPSLTIESFTNGTILLQNDCDNFGDYIKEWNYTEPLVEKLSYLTKKKVD